MTDTKITLTADDTTARALVATIRAAVNGNGKYAAYVAAHGVTKDSVKDHAHALAVLAYPNLKPVQTANVDGTKVRTKFGNAVQAAANGLRYALDKDPATSTTDYLKAVLKAAESAVNHDIDAETVRVAVEEYLNSL